MKQLSSFLDKFKFIIRNDAELKKNIIISVKKNTNIDIKGEDISIKNSIIYIKEKPQVKNEIFMRKEKILKYLILSGIKNISDIR